MTADRAAQLLAAVIREMVDDAVGAALARQAAPAPTRLVYSTATAAEALSLSPRTVRDLIRDGKLVGHRDGTDWRITRAALEDYAARFDRPMAGRRAS